MIKATLQRKWFKFLRWAPLLSKEHFYKAFYKYYNNHELDLEDPKLINEKITWMKMYLHDPMITTLADKVKVREFVKSRIGESYLNEVYGIYKRPEDINWDDLPDQFVAKVNHSAGRNKIILDKSKVNRKEFNAFFRKYLKEDYYMRRGLEWAYKNIERRILIEKLLVQPGMDDLIDYKFYCFNGEPDFVQVNQHVDGVYFKDFMTLDWIPTIFKHSHRERTDAIPTRPENFEEMIELAKKLTNGLPFVRCDFYNIAGKIVFGEMTFYPSDARRQFEPYEYNRILGDKITLPKIPAGQKEITDLGISY
ncbi:ATP-grasp fold amidoligase family protein [Nonlabens ponticola]|uniref:Glycosyltransferase n=1 Tax=Nonlabens ponticola TaxID=2496866 RepID=A0A3S9MXH8_9FLAO|nr:ATP-grasp fold amidoligase family protein [Nonlabens ponticola]AZQ43753.1 glycosyltransferase [Nonlabens ponticola]